jgi:hypothetical protein
VDVVRVYVTADQVWRIEVARDGTVRVYQYGGLRKRASSVHLAAEWLRTEGVTELEPG